MFDWITSPDAWIAFVTLLALEIVLGIDNIIFISILTNKLPKEKQAKAQRVGLALALVMRLGLLFSLAWMMKLTYPLLHIGEQKISGRDLILLIGGLFLIYKSVKEIHEKVENAHASDTQSVAKVAFSTIIFQIVIVDLVFSLDSVITAVGMVNEIGVMVAAVVVSMIVMMLLAKGISDFVNEHPAVKVLALAFLIMIGASLIAHGLHFHIPKGYIYFSLAFAVGVEFLNITIKTRKDRAQESKPHTEKENLAKEAVA
jgi:predicted tellurium resistance membrane protein TerC